MHWFDWEWKDSTGGGVWGGRGRGFGGKLPFMAYLGRLRPKEVPFAGKEICHFPGSNPGVDTICGLSLLLVISLALRGFLRVLQFSPLLKNPHLQIPIRSGIGWTKNHFVDVLPPNYYYHYYYYYYYYYHYHYYFMTVKKLRKCSGFVISSWTKCIYSQLEGMQRSRYVKEVLIIANWRYMKGVPFLSLMVYIKVRGWTLGRSLPASLPQLRKRFNWNYHLQLSIIMNTATD